MDVAHLRYPERGLLHGMMVRHLLLLVMQGCCCHCLYRWQRQRDLLLLLQLLLMVMAIARVENGVYYLGDVVFDVAVDLSTHRFEDREYCLLEDSRLLNGAAD